MEKRNWYAEAIEILMEKVNVDQAHDTKRRMLVLWAKGHPKTFVEAFYKASLSIRTDIWGEIDSIIKSDRLIEAIKKYRELSRSSLKEAKDAVEQRRRDLGIQE